MSPKTSFIQFNAIELCATDLNFFNSSWRSNQLSGNGPFTEKSESLIENVLTNPRTLLTSSCTHSLEMSALLANFQPGDEVIVPSYTFVSTASAFALYGAGKPV